MSKNALKVPKGTRDWVGCDLELRDHISRTISTSLEKHGAVQLDTPVFELREILAEKYGEDAKLIYNLEDQGGEALSLRYDLTVPFARWLAMHTDVQHIKRYQIAKVYRRDQPAIARGRMREFYQCDFDIAGTYDGMIPDAEIIRIIGEVFRAFDLPVTVKLNHRLILDGMFAVAGVPADKIRTISAAVDKLDKTPWAEVREEMVAKGLPEEVADRVGSYAQRSGTLSGLLEELWQDADLVANESVAAGLADLGLLATYLEAMDVADLVSFDLSLARGLDYYTGVIYEVTPRAGGKDIPPGVGSIAAGGRYDNLVGMYGKRPVPCVGISFGVDRIFTLLDARRPKAKNTAAASPPDVFVMAFGGKEFQGLLSERMRVATRLWDAGIRAEYAPKVKPRKLQQFNASAGVPVAVMLGDEEVRSGQVRVKRLHVGNDKGDGDDSGEKDGEKEKDMGKLVPLDRLVEEVKLLLDEASLETAKIR